jgi:hypothetical protein
VLEWDDRLPAAFATMTRPDDLLVDKLRPEHADVAAYSFVKFLARNAKGYRALLDALRDGQDFEKAFLAAYKGPPARLAEAWVATAPRPGKRKR